MQLVDPAHELEVVFADRAWFAIQAVPADPEQACLTGKAQLFLIDLSILCARQQTGLVEHSSQKIILQRQLANLRVQ